MIKLKLNKKKISVSLSGRFLLQISDWLKLVCAGFLYFNWFTIILLVSDWTKQLVERIEFISRGVFVKQIAIEFSN